MKILRKMVEKYKVPVTITFNYIYYLREQYDFIIEIMQKLISIGFDEFIIADIAFISYLRSRNIKCKIHLSGECAELNDFSIDFFNQFQISRYIFHRKNTIMDMQQCINNNKEKNLQYEAFMLNEKCHYTGAFCSSLHCDELAHLCKIQYIMAKTHRTSELFKEVDEKFEKYYEESTDEKNNIDDNYIFGNSGCGICALKNLKKAGITHLKVVGRGNFIDNIEKDVKNLKQCLKMMDEYDEKEYIAAIKEKMFLNECSGTCYY